MKNPANTRGLLASEASMAEPSQILDGESKNQKIRRIKAGMPVTAHALLSCSLPEYLSRFPTVL